jgi:CubicO group peptidase (beta-lactamase class C family)
MKRIIFTYCLTVILLISSVPLIAQTKLDKRFVGIEAEINKILKDHHAAGVAVAVVEKNKVIYAKGFGYRDVENKLPVTANTQFELAPSFYFLM